MNTNTAITPASAALCERLQTIKRTYRLTFDTIAKQAGMSRSTVINQMNGHFNIDVRVMLAIATLCPDVSADYLLRGRGDILAQDNMAACTIPLTNLEARVTQLEKMMNNITENGGNGSATQNL
jgi:transcriptional regulator with XRE-family HTH domain